MSTEQLQFAFASLDFPGRVSLRVEEIADKLSITPQHVLDLIVEGKLQAVDVRGEGSTRACYRVPVESYRDFVVRALTTPAERMRLLRELPKATLRELRRELDQLIAA
jgi:hypothetical protein